MASAILAGGVEFLTENKSVGVAEAADAASRTTLGGRKKWAPSV
jgi:hypothetical protein